MQIVFSGDNLHEMSKPIFRKKWKYHEFAQGVQDIKETEVP